MGLIKLFKIFVRVMRISGKKIRRVELNFSKKLKDVMKILKNFGGQIRIFNKLQGKNENFGWLPSQSATG